MRPHRVEALLEAARQHAEADEFDEAEALTVRALELDPEHRVALSNLARFRFYAGRLAAGSESLDALAGVGEFTDEFAMSLAARLMLRGQLRESLVVLERLDPEWSTLDGDRAWVEAGKSKAAGETLLTDAFEGCAHHLWARKQAAGGSANRAIAVYRQNLRITRDYVPGGAKRVRLELCAAEWLAGKEESAAATARELDPQAADWASLPDWAGTALRDSGLFP